MSKKRKKRPAPTSPPAKTTPSPHTFPGSDTSDQRLCWRFGHVDEDGPWGLAGVDADTLRWLLDKLARIEDMTVNQAFHQGDEPGKHYDPSKIPTPQARDRLHEMNLADQTQISRLRFQGQPRLYGFMVGNVFHVVWWDPNHEIWPALKKHT